MSERPTCLPRIRPVPPHQLSIPPASLPLPSASCAICKGWGALPHLPSGLPMQPPTEGNPQPLPPQTGDARGSHKLFASQAFTVRFAPVLQEKIIRWRTATERERPCSSPHPQPQLLQLQVPPPLTDAELPPQPRRPRPRAPTPPKDPEFGFVKHRCPSRGVALRSAPPGGGDGRPAGGPAGRPPSPRTWPAAQQCRLRRRLQHPPLPGAAAAADRSGEGAGAGAARLRPRPPEPGGGRGKLPRQLCCAVPRRARARPERGTPLRLLLWGAPGLREVTQPHPCLRQRDPHPSRADPANALLAK